MEDLIYILIGVIWVAASIYQVSRKRKEKARSQLPAGHSPQTAPRKREGRSLLEELLNGQQVQIPEPAILELEERESKPLNPPVQKKLLSFQEEYARYGLKGLEASHEKKIRKTPDIIKIKPTVKKGKSIPFNLRKAIIYRAILERPYT
jgi:hypothetical protein